MNKKKITTFGHIYLHISMQNTEFRYIYIKQYQKLELDNNTKHQTGLKQIIQSYTLSKNTLLLTLSYLNNLLA